MNFELKLKRINSFFTVIKSIIYYLFQFFVINNKKWK
jgi:hypothetical protein